MMSVNAKVAGRALLALILVCVICMVAYWKRDIIREKYEFYLLSPVRNVLEETLDPGEYIAHAGGVINGHTSTNSLDALDANYDQGVRFFEIDLCWTADDQLAAIHDWNRTKDQLFGESKGAVSADEFLKMKMKGQLTQMLFRDIAQWLSDHPDAYIVTDVKGRNVEALSKIAQEHPESIPQIIPQIYRFNQLNAVRELGFPRFIITLYLSRYSDAGVVRFAQEQRPWAVTMPVDRAMSSLPQELGEHGFFVYSHGVNDTSLQSSLYNNGVDGLYTSSLHLSNEQEDR